MNWWQAIIMGIVQGITEFLPVSSSGHLVLTEKLLGIENEQSLLFATMLHVGTLMAVIVVMRKELFYMIKHPKSPILRYLVIASIPACIAGLLLHGYIDMIFDGRFLGVSFLLTASLLFSVMLSKSGEREIDNMNYKDAVAAGFGQVISLLPAVSRSGSCLVPLLFRKMARKDAIRFAFLMSIPVIFGSFVLDLIRLFRGSVVLSGAEWLNVSLGVLFSTVFGFIAMKFMLKHLTRKGLVICGAYVLTLAVFVILDQIVFGWIM